MTDVRDQAGEMLGNFLKAWRDQDWKALYLATQLTTRELWNEERLAEVYGKMTLQSWYVTDCVKQSDVMVDVSAKCWIEVAGGVRTDRVKARVVCELAPYQPSEDGTWGVNPISVLGMKVAA